MATNDLTQDCSHSRDVFISYLTEHKHQIFNLIFCMVHNLSDAEDVFQETCVALWTNFERFEIGTNFGAWASRVAHHRVLGFLRSKRRDRMHFSDSLMEQFVELPAESFESQQLRLDALAACRQSLSPADQELLVACYGGQDKIRDVACQLQRPAQSVYSSLSRIRRALHHCVERRLAREGLP